MIGFEFEKANKYMIYDSTGSKEFLYAVEQTGCCHRQLKSCFGECIGWNVNIMHVEDGRRDLAYKLVRPQTCTCGPFNRPVMELTDADGKMVGKVKDPCSCFSLRMHAMDPSGQDIFTVNGGCCQLGLYCPCPCGPCSVVHF